MKIKPQDITMNNKLFAITLLIVGLVIGGWLSTPVCYATDPEDLPWSNESDIIILPWSNETDIIIFPAPPLPPFFRYFDITPTEIVLGEDLAISFVIENPNNQSITRMSATRIGDFFTQIIEIRLEAYESKFIYYRIIPHVVGEYDVWIDGQTGTFKVISTEIIIVIDPLEELNEQIDYLDTNLQNLTREFFLLQTAYNTEIEELNSKIDTIETTFDEQVEALENKISSLQASILYACIASAIIAIVGAFLLIKRMQ